MAYQIENETHRSRLQRALRRSFSDSHESRQIRENLVKIYQDNPNRVPYYHDDRQDLGTLINLFQKYVKGHLLSLAYNSPKWAIDSRTEAASGFDSRVEDFLTRYMEIMDFHNVQKQLALDSAFGWCVCKVDYGLPPKGITAPVAPRCYRINPDMLIVDRAAATITESSFIGDMFLVPLNEAKEYEGFDSDMRSKLTEWRFSSGTHMLPNNLATEDAFSEPMVRLIDVYIPKSGKIYTWEAPNDEFHFVSQAPLGERETPINPYEVMYLLTVPGQVIEISRLQALRGLHLLTNEMLDKGVQQARASQRNPLAPLGSEQDMSTAMNAGDNNPIFLAEPEKLGLYSIPGPDPSILGLSSFAGQLFSTEAGNLEVALGASTGADTAKQTEALLGQISASQSIDRAAFELFLANIARKMATLAFHSELLELETRSEVPGTDYSYSRKWAPASMMPRVAHLSEMHFSVVPYSTVYRQPEERLAQLNAASQLIMTWMTAAAQGAPINLDAVMKSVKRSFDLVPELGSWWSGEPPTPADKVQNTYTSLAAPAEGSEVNYNGVDGGGGNQAFAEPQSAGVE